MRVIRQLYFRKRRRMFRACDTLYRQDDNALTETWYVFHGLSFTPGTMCHPTHGFFTVCFVLAALLFFPFSFSGSWYIFQLVLSFRRIFPFNRVYKHAPETETTAVSWVFFFFPPAAHCTLTGTAAVPTSAVHLGIAEPSSPE